MVNEARSMARTSSRSPGRIGSTDRCGTVSQLRLGRSKVQRRELSGADAVAQYQPLASEHGHAGRRRQPPRRRRPARVRRRDSRGAVADEQRGLGEPRRELVGRQGEIFPLASQPVAVVAVQRGVDLGSPRLDDRTHGKRRPRYGGRHRVERRHGGDRHAQRPRHALGRPYADPQSAERSPAHRHRDAVEAEVREKIHLEILKRTGAYHANDHVLLPSGQHTSEYIEKTLVTTEPSFTEGLGAVIAKHFAQWPVDLVLSTGPGALILSHCVARAHPSRPVVVYGTKGLSGGKRRVSLPVEFHRLLRPGTKVLLVEDLVSTGSTLNLLIELAEQLGAQIAGVGCLWRRTSVDLGGRPVFSLVSRDFPTYSPEECPLCRKGIPLNEEFVRRRTHRKASAVQEPRAF